MSASEQTPMAWSVPGPALGPWGELQRALERADPPCAGGGRALWHGSRREQEAAALACLHCPLMVACGEYADAAGERFGTWGGITEKERRERNER